jgi:hypothetical protein
MTVKSFEQQLSTSSGFPGSIRFSFSNDGRELRAELVGKFGKKEFRQFDPWTLACIVDVKQKTNIEVSNVVFVINRQKITDKLFGLNLESFRRRVSFLGINNPGIKFEILLNDEKVFLYDKKSLFHRPGNEIIHSKITKRGDDDKPGRLEKDFQTFLYGKGLKERTNNRLAILGEDFYQIKEKDFGILREFPTGVFDRKISKDTKIMPTEFVDIITVNKWGHLTVIELKLDNPALEVISQILDYGLYFRCYREQLEDVQAISNTFNVAKIKKAGIFCYVVNNHFHPRFDGILKFYTKTKNYGFCLKKVVLGETVEI